MRCDCADMPSGMEIKGGRHYDFNFWMECRDCGVIVRWWPKAATQEMIDLQKETLGEVE